MSSSSGFFKATNNSKHQNERASFLFKKKIDLSKVSLPHFNIYLARKITSFLDGFDDEVTIAMVQNSLAAGLNSCELQDVLEPIIGLAYAKELVIELYDLLIEASKTSDGIPSIWKEDSKSIISSQSLSQDRGFIEALKKAKLIATLTSKNDDKIKMEKGGDGGGGGGEGGSSSVASASAKARKFDGAGVASAVLATSSAAHGSTKREREQESDEIITKIAPESKKIITKKE